ncbi:MAG: Asp23/Gls24 family envelope stress response protein [Cloacibacillus porcorum]|uniref:Asp23/Gls24 family envelope stress response protein n=1 Tax=Cloacibacillus porcorum TaxID=1197717 RepID=UPI0023F4D64F|nr:Asp23/Gls24 family envelope stress response protein [Cloacibacillus porcorum]MCD7875908.1 Asp23/Gls24 family envelope stress response protein [Cloacibacillus porcorum]
MVESMNEDFNVEEKQDMESGLGQTNLEGKVRISEDVIAQLATKALNRVEGVSPASPGLMANLRLGRKTVNGVRISISDGDSPEIVVDAYISVKYGLRIPDVCWDVQEAVKEQVERYTGYAIKGVNIYVQGIAFAEKKTADGEAADAADMFSGEEA